MSDKDLHTMLVHTVLDSLNELLNVKTELKALKRALEKKHPATFRLYGDEARRLRDEKHYRESVSKIATLQGKLRGH